MNLAFLRVDAVNKPSYIAESGAETQVNIHHIGENLIARHKYDLEDPPYCNHLQRQSKSQFGSNLSLVHAFHVIPHKSCIMNACSQGPTR
jgi:hypothetical protein